MLNMNKKFNINDDQNYLLSLRQNSSQEDGLDQPCHRVAQGGRQRSVIMMASRKANPGDEFQYLFDTNEEEHHVDYRSDEQTDYEQIGEADMNLFLQDRSFVEYH